MSPIENNPNVNSVLESLGMTVTEKPGGAELLAKLGIVPGAKVTMGPEGLKVVGGGSEKVSDASSDRPTISAANPFFADKALAMIRDYGLEGEVRFGETGRTRSVMPEMRDLPTGGGLYTLYYEGQPTDVKLDLGHWNMGFDTKGKARTALKRVDKALAELCESEGLPGKVASEDPVAAPNAADKPAMFFDDIEFALKNWNDFDAVSADMVKDTKAALLHILQNQGDGSFANVAEIVTVTAREGGDSVSIKMKLDGETYPGIRSFTYGDLYRMAATAGMVRTR